MANYTIRIRGGGDEDVRRIEASDLAEAAEIAESGVEDWIDEGEWGDEGASVEGEWAVYAADDTDLSDELDSGSVTVEIEPDEDELIRRAVQRVYPYGGEDADRIISCDHDWTATVEDEGGVRENPGVFGCGGTTIALLRHCARCGLRVERVLLGSQRNPGEHDTVEFWIGDEDEDED